MSFKDLSEAEIIKKIKEMKKKEDLYGDVIRQYFQEIYHRYYFQCYNISRYYGLNRQDAEDAVQEAFIKLLKSIETYDENRPFKPWFFRVVLNAVKDRYRELKKHRYTEIENITDYADGKQENFFEEFHTRNYFHGIIIRLPKKLKSVVVLRNYTDMSLDAISASLNISVRQLHNRLTQAYELIKIEMEGLKS